VDPNLELHDQEHKHGFSDDPLYQSWSHFWLNRNADQDSFVQLMEPETLPMAPGIRTTFVWV
jgi:hypothetical protein